MNKRFIGVVLTLSIFFNTLFSSTFYIFAEKAEEYGYVKVSINGSLKIYSSLKKEDDLYLRAEDIAQITGYDLEIKDFIAYSKTGGLDTVTAVDIEFDGTTHAMGKEYSINVINGINGIFLPLNQMLYLLHSQWCMENDCIMVQPLPYTIIDFLGDGNYKSMWENKVNQTDLLINGESELAHWIRSSFAAVFNDFDPMMFVVWWPGEGMTPALNKEYENALLQIAIDDENFLDSYGQKEISKLIEESGFSQIKNNWNIMGNLVDIPENLLGGTTQFVEGFNKISEDLSKLSKKHKFFKFNNYNDLSYLSPPRLKAFSKEMEALSDGMDIIECLIKVSEVYNRSSHWGKDFIDQIRILTNFDDMGYNKITTNRVKRVASNLIQEYEDPIIATTEEFILQSISLFSSKIFDASPFGKYCALFNAGIAIAETDETVKNIIDVAKNSIDAADLAYMVDCLVKTEYIAMNEMSRSYDKLLGNIVNGDLTDQDLKRLRNCVMLSLRTNLRNRAFIYYLNQKLNNDSNWESSIQAQNIRNQINNDYVLLCQVMETEAYDKLILLNDFENMYSDEFGKLREKIDTTVFYEGEYVNETVVYKEILDQYKDAELQNYYGGNIEEMPNVNPEVYLSGYSDAKLYYTMQDLNSDGMNELIIASLSDKYENGYEIYDMYQYKNGMIQRLCEEHIGYRIRYRLCENNIIRKTLSGGVYNISYQFYKMANDGSSLYIVDQVQYEGTNGDSYYHGELFDPASKISRQEYEQIIAQYVLLNNIEWKEISSKQVKTQSTETEKSPQSVDEEKVNQITELILKNEVNWWNDGCTGIVGVHDINLDHQVEWMVEQRGGSSRNSGFNYYNASSQQFSYLCELSADSWELYLSPEKTCYFIKKVTPQTAGWVTTQYIERAVLNGTVQDGIVLFQKDEIDWALEKYQPQIFEGRIRNSDKLIICKNSEQEISEEEMQLGIDNYKASMVNSTNEVRILSVNWNPNSSIEEKRMVIKNLLLDAYYLNVEP